MTKRMLKRYEEYRVKSHEYRRVIMLRWFGSLTKEILENVKRRCGLKERRISARGFEGYLYPRMPNRATPNDSLTFTSVGHWNIINSSKV